MPPSPSRSDGSQRIFQPGNDKVVENQDLAHLPAHVNTVKEGLLDFNRFLGLEALMRVLGDEDSDDVSDDEGAEIPLSAYKADAEDSKASQRAQEVDFLENAQKLARGAQRLEGEFVEDSRWRRLFRTAVINRMDDGYYSNSCLPNTIAWAENQVWATDLDPSQHLHANPKPDLAFGFPVYNPENQKAVGFKNDPFLQNYTINTLSRLAMSGLRAVPAAGPLTGTPEVKRDSTEQLLCFPWCIIQSKGLGKAAASDQNEDLVSETICQASVAASGALSLLEKLARFADSKQDGQHIPPVIVITSVGPDTTVWLAFSEIIDDQYRDHTMLSIWDGCISKIWDSIQFCRIMDNLFFWSQHILRPKVTHYIDQWRLRYYPEVHSHHSQLEKDTKTADLVHRIQDRLSSLGISPNSDLPELIQQAVILHEVVRSNPRKPEPASMEDRVPNAQEEEKGSKEVSFHPKQYVLLAEAPNSVVEGSGQKGSRSREEDSSTASQDKPTLRQKPTEANVSVLASPVVRYGASANRDAAAIEDKQAAPSEVPPTDEHVSITELHTGSEIDKKQYSGAPFLYPYKFKSSDFKLDEERFHCYSPKPTRTNFNTINRRPRVMASRIASKYPRPLRRHQRRTPSFDREAEFDTAAYERSLAASVKFTTSKDSAQTMDSSNQSGSVDAETFPAQPSRFTYKSFPLSFDVGAWQAGLGKPPAPRWMRDTGPPSALPKPSTLASRTDDADDFSYDSLGRIIRSEPPKRRKPECQQTGTPKTAPLDVKIPFKDRFIRVRLPPVTPAPPPPARGHG